MNSGCIVHQSRHATASVLRSGDVKHCIGRSEDEDVGFGHTSGQHTSWWRLSLWLLSHSQCPVA